MYAEQRMYLRKTADPSRSSQTQESLFKENSVPGAHGIVLPPQR